MKDADEELGLERHASFWHYGTTDNRTLKTSAFDGYNRRFPNAIRRLVGYFNFAQFNAVATALNLEIAAPVQIYEAIMPRLARSPVL